MSITATLASIGSLEVVRRHSYTGIPPRLRSPRVDEWPPKVDHIGIWQISSA
jgi:hypothetical protein